MGDTGSLMVGLVNSILLLSLFRQALHTLLILLLLHLLLVSVFCFCR
jgi:UDP-N-acetylmuramyl pentapeptide phosphotransferase/UDP-N-acetylglucosamine-1-phosphate transferase